MLSIVGSPSLGGPDAIERRIDPDHPGRPGIAGDVGVVDARKISIGGGDGLVVAPRRDAEDRVGIPEGGIVQPGPSAAWTASVPKAGSRSVDSAVDSNAMDSIRVIDVVDDEAFRLVPPCADPGFDHRSCDFWEDADRGSKAARSSWLQPARLAASDAPATPAVPRPANPFLADLEAKTPTANPFAASRPNPFLSPDEDDDAPAANPFAPPPRERQTVDPGAPRKLQLLGRGLGVVGSYAKVLLLDDIPAVYAQFGPLSAYPRAQRTRDLYPALPDSPLPAVITCIASTRAARHQGLAHRLVDVVCADLEARGFAAVETYPEAAANPDATSAATPAFWETLGFKRAVDDDRFPVMRREFA